MRLFFAVTIVGISFPALPLIDSAVRTTFVFSCVAISNSRFKLIFSTGVILESEDISEIFPSAF